MLNSQRYINQALSNKENGIPSSHELIEFINKVEEKYGISIVDAIKIERPIHEDVLVNIITDTRKDSRPLISELQSQIVLREIYKECYDKFCSTDVESLEALVQNKLYSEITDFVSDRFLPVWNLQAFNSTFIFFLWNDYDCHRMKNFADQVEEEINSVFWSKETFGYLSEFRIKVSFDSKENLDKNFGGSFRAYFD